MTRTKQKPDDVESVTTPRILAMLRSYVSVGRDSRMRMLSELAWHCISNFQRSEEESQREVISPCEISLSIRLAKIERCAREMLATSDCDSDTRNESRRKLIDLLDENVETHGVPIKGQQSREEAADCEREMCQLAMRNAKLVIELAEAEKEIQIAKRVRKAFESR